MEIQKSAEIQNNSILLLSLHPCLTTPLTFTSLLQGHCPCLASQRSSWFFSYNGWLRKRYSRAKVEPIRLNQKMMREGRQWDNKVPALWKMQMEQLAFPDWLTECQPVSRCQISSRDEGIPSAVLWYAVSDMICDCSTQNIQGQYFLTLRSSQCSSIKLRRIITYCNCLFHFFRDNTWSKKWRGYRIAALWHQWWRRDLLACSWLKPTHLSIKDS